MFDINVEIAEISKRIDSVLEKGTAIYRPSVSKQKQHLQVEIDVTDLTLGQQLLIKSAIKAATNTSNVKITYRLSDNILKANIIYM
jgi:hypothetical protein